MEDDYKKRIEELELKVKNQENKINELDGIVKHKKEDIRPGTLMGKYINKVLFKTFGVTNMCPEIAQCKNGLNSIIGKAFGVHGIVYLTKEQVKDAESLINFVANFISKNRNKYKVEKLNE